MVKQVAERIKTELKRVIVGQERTIDLLLVGLFSGGHVLLEDVPGVGKTVLAKALAAALGCRFSRIQCTPDLLPQDLLGTTVYNQKRGEFEFHQGPLFSNLVLADEINRAIPRTQSALLEAMGEGQISVDGQSRVLERPFFVMATQNPVEYQGTFPLPEAQLDRFALKISLGYPTMEEEARIWRLSREVSQAGNNSLAAVVTPAEISLVQQRVAAIHMSVEVEGYLIELVSRTRRHEEILLGASPRALLALGAAAQAYAAIQGRDYVIPDDIKNLVPLVLAHRLLLQSAARLKQRTAQAILAELVEQVPVPVENPVRGNRD